MFLCMTAERDGVVSVLPNTILKLHTTKSWDFMGVTIGGTLRLPTEADVIVGLLDTGICNVICFRSTTHWLCPFSYLNSIKVSFQQP